MNIPTMIPAGILGVGVFSVKLFRNISTNGNPLKAMHVRMDRDISKRIVRESGQQTVARQDDITHTFQELHRPHKHSMVVIILLRERTKYFQHKDTLR